MTLIPNALLIDVNEQALRLLRVYPKSPIIWYTFLHTLLIEEVPSGVVSVPGIDLGGGQQHR